MPESTLATLTELHDLAKRIVLRRDRYERPGLIDPAEDLLDDRFWLLRQAYPFRRALQPARRLPNGLTLDWQRCYAYAFGRPIRLSPPEWRLLGLLARSCGWLVQWPIIDLTIWGRITRRALTRQILWLLRGNLAQAGLPDLIETKHNIGLRLIPGAKEDL